MKTGRVIVGVMVCGMLNIWGARDAAAWTVNNMSPSADVSNSLPWVAARINEGAADNNVDFAITNPPPHVFTFPVTFYQEARVYGQPSVVMAATLRFELGGSVYDVAFSNTMLYLGSSDGIVGGCRFRNCVIELDTSYDFRADNDAANCAFTLIRSNVVARARRCGMQLLASGGGNLVSNCGLVSVNCQSGGNTFMHNVINGTCQLQGDDNRLFGNRITTSWANDLSVQGRSNVFADNVIYSNRYGIYVVGGGYHTFARNRIGCDEDGVTALPCYRAGIWLDRSVSNCIGGDMETEGNIIGSCSNSAAIIDMAGYGNRIEGNLIGVGADGETPLPIAAGIYLDRTTQAVVGAMGRGNVIGSARAYALQGTACGGLSIVANRIGTSRNGLVARGNGSGVMLSDCLCPVLAGNTIGASRGSYGLELQRCHGANLWGNHIGVNLHGTAALANGLGGVYVYECNNVRIGGPDVYQRNIIAGNEAQSVYDGQGILVKGGAQHDCHGTQIVNNHIGIDRTGTNHLGNAGAGVQVLNASGVTIGMRDGAPNIIAGNGGAGIVLASDSMFYPATNNVARGNRVERNAAHGISVTHSNAYGNLIVCNRVVGNGSNAVDIVRGLRNTISSNGMYGNALMGINLGVQGRNDGPESDAQANRYQRYPFISNVVAAGGTRVRGSLTSAASKTYRLEFFATPAASPAGFGEGQQYLGAVDVTTGAGGSVGFDVVLPVAAQPGWIVTATATDPGGNTSELCEQKIVNGVKPDFRVNKTLAKLGEAVQFTDVSLGAPVSWNWDFDNDGTTDSTLQNPSYAYASAGDKTVKLTASNQYGAASETKVALVRLMGATLAVGPGDDVQAVINASQPYDTIMLSAGVYRASTKWSAENVIALQKRVTIIGMGSPGDVIIDGEYARRCLYVVSGRVVNVTCVNGMATNSGTKLSASLNESGGGVLLVAGEMERCIVRNCRAVEGGGAKALGGGWLRSCLIVSNEAQEGGGLALGNGVVACNLTIADNAASTAAGGVLLAGGELWNSIVTRNTAPTNENWQRNDGVMNYSCAQPHPGGFDSTDADPGLQEDYTIPLSSPVTDRGNEFGWMSSASDLAGDVRVYGSAPDMGAYEAVPEAGWIGVVGVLALVAGMKK